MSLSISRLRTWFALLALAAVAVVAGFYVWARIEMRRTLRNLPAKVGVGIQQTSQGFTFSKSEGGRTLFTIHASKATQFKAGGRAALHDVRIVVYGRHSNRFDQIYGSDFEYDPSSGTVSSAGEVQIDLQAQDPAAEENAAAGSAKDRAANSAARAGQAAQDDARDRTIHLRAEGLVFDQKQGIGQSQGQVEFRLPQAQGTAQGAFYDSKKSELTLRSDIDVHINGEQPAHIVARSGTITKEPRQLTLEGAQLTGQGRTLIANRAVALLGADNTVQRVDVAGNVRLSDAGRTLLADKAIADLGASNVVRRVEALGKVRLSGDGGMQVRAPKAELIFGAQGAARNVVQSAWFGGGVDFQSGAQGSDGHAGEMRMLFSAPDSRRKLNGGAVELRTILASGGVLLRQQPREGAHNAQTMTLKSDAITFAVNGAEPTSAKEGQMRATRSLRLTSAETEGPGELTIDAVSGGAAKGAGETVVDAHQFKALFGDDSRLRTLHGRGGVQIVSRAAGEPDKVSTSETVTAEFGPSGEIARAVLEGGFHYREGQSSHPGKPNAGLPRTPSTNEMGGRSATAARAIYSPKDDSLVLSGEPRIVDGGMIVEADNIRLLRQSGESFATGNVKSTYSQLKVQPNGALLATSEPVHVTAHAMTVQQSPGVAHYTGGARLWQGSNVVQAQTIDFDERARTIVASGNAQHPLTCVFEQRGGKAQSTTMVVSAQKLSYDDKQRQAHYSGGVIAKSADGVLTAGRADVLLSTATTAHGGSAVGPSQLERIVASSHVTVEQGARRVEGERLVYEAADGVYTMSGGRPSLSDPAHGTVRGDALTFYSRDDRVVVEGGESSRAVTHTHLSR